MPAEATVLLTLTGVEGVPLLTHNERLANPRDEYARAMKLITAKRKKTDDDIEEMARLEFLGGLYLDEANEIRFPSWNVKRSLQDGAKITRAGKTIERGVRLDEPDWVGSFTYAGPTSLVERWAWDGAVDQRSVKVGTSKVTRTRPRFMDWEIRTTVTLDLGVLSVEDFSAIADVAGSTSGMGDFRPRFGRYNADVKEIG